MLSKGEETKKAALKAGLRLVSLEGFEKLSVARLAKSAGLSKSGLFAHFSSKESLELELIESAHQHFSDAVIRPALLKERGIARVSALLKNWLSWDQSESQPGGCIFLAAAQRFKEEANSARSALLKSQLVWLGVIEKALQISLEEGHLNPEAPTRELAEEIHRIGVGFQMQRALLPSLPRVSRGKKALLALLRPHLSENGLQILLAESSHQP